jgi:hypothetical protein
MAEQQHGNSKGREALMRKALAAHQLGGIRVKKPHNRAVTWVDRAGNEYKLLKSEKKQQFMWCTTECRDKVQHFKLCTPDAVRKPVALMCCFCTYESGAWEAAGRPVIPPAEWKFMQLVAQQQQSQEWCWQVHLTDCHGRIDFYNWKRDVYLQVDDSYHFRDGCKNKAFERDFKCSKVCCERRLALVRAHHADLAAPDIVMAAVEYASQHKGVVFTASYELSGKPHIEKLCAGVGAAAATAADAFGNQLVNL